MSNWDGVNRRREEPIYCEQHITLVKSLAEIGTSVKNIENGILQSSNFRRAVITAIIVQALMFATQLVLFANIYGQLTRQVEVNSRRLDVMENLQRSKDAAYLLGK